MVSSLPEINFLIIILLLIVTPCIIAFTMIGINELDRSATMEEFVKSKGSDNFKYVSLNIKEDSIKKMYTVIIEFPYIPPKIYKEIADKYRYIHYSRYFYRQDKIVYKINITNRVKIGDNLTKFCRDIDNYLISQKNVR